MFDRVVLINLKRRPDRLEAFRARQKEAGWELPEPTVFEAVDGSKVGVPTYFQSGGGAWGCCRSHVRVCEQAVMDGVESLLVFEDDVTWKADEGGRSAWEQLRRFMAAVPADWEQLMLGGQHLQPALPTPAPGVVRCTNCQRTHAYAVRGKAIKDLLGLWYPANRHIDHVMGPWQKDRKVYAPERFVFGQAEGKSDINGRHNPAKFWVPPAAGELLVHLDAPKEVAERLRGMGFHTGYTRDPDTGYDKGLESAANASGPVRKHLLRKWVDTVLWEVASAEGQVACVWHPKVKPAELAAVHRGRLVEVRGATAEECLAQLPSGVRLKDNYAATHVVHLSAEREVAEALRGHGFHMGNWRDEVTGYDNGLRQAVTMRRGRPERIARWVDEVSREAQAMTHGVACCWHHEITPEELAACAGGRKVVPVSGSSVGECLEAFRRSR